MAAITRPVPLSTGTGTHSRARLVGIANALGVVSLLPVLYFWFAKFYAHSHPADPKLWNVPRSLLYASVLLCIFAVWQGSAWWRAAYVLILGTFLMVMLNIR